MLIALIIFALCLLAVFVCGIAIGRTGREALRLELANIRGKHETLAEAYQDMRRIAGEAVQAAREKHFPEKAINREHHDQIEKQFKTAAPNYIPPVEKHCPACSVSVRADSWPQECPNCHSVFGFDE